MSLSVLITKAENWKQRIGSWILKAFERIALGEKQVKASIAWDYPYYLFIFNHLIHNACVYLDVIKDILDICILNLETFGTLHWVVFASA